METGRPHGPPVNPLAVNRLKALATLHRFRAESYGESWAAFGRVCDAIWPDGKTIAGEAAWTRFGVLCQVISKLTRHEAGRMKVPDTLDDLAVYAAMLAELEEREQIAIDARIEKEKETAKRQDDAISDL